MSGIDSYHDFEAICDHMPGSTRTLRVTGTVIFRMSGWSAELRASRGNPGINPDVLSLELVVTPPGDDEITLDVLTRCPVDWCEEDPPFEYTQVHVRFPDGEGKDEPAPPIVDVLHPTRAAGA